MLSYISSKVSFPPVVSWPVQHLPGPRDPASHGRAGGAAGHGGGLLLSRHRGVPGGLQEELLLPGDEHTAAGQYSAFSSVRTEEVGFLVAFSPGSKNASQL